MVNANNLSFARAALVTVALAALPAVAVGQTDYTTIDLEGGVAFSDNIARVRGTAAEQDETIVTAGVLADIRRRFDVWDVNLTGTAKRYAYLDDTFDDETLVTLAGNATWRIIPRRLNWQFTVNHGQTIIDPFQPVTPRNREDVTIWSTGPILVIPLADRTNVSLSATYSEVLYEERPFDNERLGARVGLARNLTPSSSVSANVSRDAIEYEIPLLSPDADRTNAYLNYTNNTGRNNFSLDAGWNEIDRTGSKSDGLLLELNWGRRITQQTRVSFNAGSQLRTAGDVFSLNQRLDFSGDTQDLQDVDDPFQQDYARLAYSFNYPRTRASFAARWSKDEYETLNELNRTTSGLAVDFARDLTSRMTLKLGASFGQRDFDLGDRNDDDVSYSAGLALEFGARSTVELEARHIERDSNLAADGYEETRFGLTYTFRAIGDRD